MTRCSRDGGSEFAQFDFTVTPCPIRLNRASQRGDPSLLLVGLVRWCVMQSSTKGPQYVPVLALALCVAAVVSCGSDAPTAVSGLHGSYMLRIVDGQVVPFSAASHCGGPCTLASGSLEVLANDTVLIHETTTSPPSGGSPGLSVTTIGHFILRRVGDRFAMQPGPDITLGRPIDTLSVKGDTLVLRASAPVGFFSVRTYTP